MSHIRTNLKPVNQIALDDLIKAALIICAAGYIFIYLYCALIRLRYPFELEWLEGGLVNQVQRIVNHQGVYVAPSIDFVPFLYPPMYFALSAIASLVFGTGFFSLRLISFISSLVAFILIFSIVRHETKSRFAALLSVGLFATTFHITNGWLDVARVDSLFLALYLSFIRLITLEKTPARAIIAGLLISLTFLTKQTVLVICLPSIAFLFWKHWRYALVMLATAILVVGSLSLILNQASGGWYGFYTFALLRQQTEWIPVRLITFWVDDLLRYFPLAVPIGLLFFITPSRPKLYARIQWLLILAGALFGGLITFAKEGGYYNLMLPAYAIIAILLGLGLNELLEALQQSPTPANSFIKKFIYLACLSQFLLLLYNPFTLLPNESDKQANLELIQILKETKGAVFMPDHSYLPEMVGKQTFAHHSAIWDIRRGTEQSLARTLLSESLRQAIQQQAFDVIILNPAWNYCCEDIDQYYIQTKELWNTEFDHSLYEADWPTYIYIAKRLK